LHTHTSWLRAWPKDGAVSRARGRLLQPFTLARDKTRNAGLVELHAVEAIRLNSSSLGHGGKSPTIIKLQWLVAACGAFALVPLLQKSSEHIKT
jgi:hypothetical protein